MAVAREKHNASPQETFTQLFQPLLLILRRLTKATDARFSHADKSALASSHSRRLAAKQDAASARPPRAARNNTHRSGLQLNPRTRRSEHQCAQPQYNTGQTKIYSHPYANSSRAKSITCANMNNTKASVRNVDNPVWSTWYGSCSCGTPEAAAQGWHNQSGCVAQPKWLPSARRMANAYTAVAPSHSHCDNAPPSKTAIKQIHSCASSSRRRWSYSTFKRTGLPLTHETHPKHMSGAWIPDHLTRPCCYSRPQA